MKDDNAEKINNSRQNGRNPAASNLFIRESKKNISDGKEKKALVKKIERFFKAINPLP